MLVWGWEKMTSYTVRKPNFQPRYLDRQGYGSFQPVPMSRGEAERVAYEGGGIVEVWEAGELVREYAMPVPQVPRLELIA